MDATKTIEGSIGSCGQAGPFAEHKDSIEPFDNQRGMSSFCGMEVGLDAEMHICRPGREPNAVAPCHGWGLLDLGQTEDTGVKLTGAIFAANRNRKLDVIEAKDWHWPLILAPVRPQPRERHRNNCRADLKRETSKQQVRGVERAEQSASAFHAARLARRGWILRIVLRSRWRAMRTSLRNRARVLSSDVARTGRNLSATVWASSRSLAR